MDYQYSKYHNTRIWTEPYRGTIEKTGMKANPSTDLKTIQLALFFSSTKSRIALLSQQNIVTMLRHLL